METIPVKQRFSIAKNDRIKLQALRTICLILLYYCFSIGLTFYQKWFLEGFPYPFTVAFCHFIFKFVLSFVTRNIYTAVTGRNRVTLHCTGNAKKLALTGISSALDIGFSNESFKYNITISLYTMTKSTCIIFILIFALIFGLEKKRVSLVAIVLLISVGLFMFTYQSTQFAPQGFILVLIASFLGGLRWTLAQLVMQRHEIGLSNPVDMIYHVQPWMMLGIFPFVIFEGIPTLNKSSFLEKLNETNLLLILFGSLLAFLMEASEYLLLSLTSSLTLSIAGIFKEIFTLYLAFQYKKDEISFFNFIGLVVCLAGISLHVILKALDASDKEKRLRIENALKPMQNY